MLTNYVLLVDCVI